MSSRARHSFVTRVRQRLTSMHPAERRLAEFVLSFPGELASYTASELAALAFRGVAHDVEAVGAFSLPVEPLAVDQTEGPEPVDDLLELLGAQLPEQGPAAQVVGQTLGTDQRGTLVIDAGTAHDADSGPF